jgi:hypothetical protein
MVFPNLKFFSVSLRLRGKNRGLLFRSPDVPITGSPDLSSPSQGIPLHPRSSQIGVSLRGGYPLPLVLTPFDPRQPHSTPCRGPRTAPLLRWLGWNTERISRGSQRAKSCLGGCFCQIPRANYQGPLLPSFFLSKIVQRTTFSLWSEFLTLPFVRLSVKQKVWLKMPAQTPVCRMKPGGAYFPPAVRFLVEERPFRARVRMPQTPLPCARRLARSVAERAK